MHKALFVLGGVFIGLGAGYFAGRELTKRQLGAEYDERLEHEINATKAYLNDHYKNKALEMVNKEIVVVEEQIGGPATTEQLERIVEVLRYGPDNTVVGPPKKPSRNIFVRETNETAEEDHSDEVSKRTKDKPYVISVDEYMEGKPGCSQVTLTYFAGDETLIDEGDNPLDDVDRIVGFANLQRFGHRSNDPRVVYVRNEKLDADYEILFHEGKYSEAVLGQVNSDEE